MDLSWYWLAMVVGVVGSAFFSGVETGLISLNRVRLRHDVERRNRRALILNTFVENTDRLLGTTLIGNNLMNVLVAVSIAALGIRWVGPGHGVELATTAVGSAVLLILGEIVPKTLFRHYSYRLCMSCADLLNAIAWLFAPLVVLLSGLMRAITRIGGGGLQPRSFFVTREELKYLTREGEVGGELTTDERRMIHGVFDFPYKTVFDVMVPLAKTVTVTRQTPVEQLLEISERTGFARFPVRDQDELTGIVNTYEILFANAARDGAGTIEPFVRKPQWVLSTERIDRVLPRLRASRIPISVVVNPDGKHLGIVTIEDIIEEIVGDVEG